MAYVTRCPYCGSVWLVPDKETADRTPLKCPDCRHSFDATCSLLKVPDELFPGRVAVALFPTGTAVTGRRSAAATAAPASSVIPTAPILSAAAPVTMQEAPLPAAEPAAPAKPADTLDAPVFTARPVAAEATAAEPDSALAEEAPAPVFDVDANDAADATNVETPTAPVAQPVAEPAAQPVLTPEADPVEEEPSPLESEEEPQQQPAAPAPASESTDAAEPEEEPAAESEEAPQEDATDAQKSDVPPEAELKKPVEPTLSPVMTPRTLSGDKAREATALSLMQTPQLSAEPRLGNLSGLKKAVAQEKMAPVTRMPRVTAGVSTTPAAAPITRPLRTPKKKGSAGSFILVLVVFVVLAAVAAIVFNQKVMEALPQTSAYYNQVCSKVPCPGFFLHNIEAFAVSKTQLRPLDESGNYALEVSVLNGSDTAQAVPYLQIELVDDNDGSLLRRTLSPEEYLDRGQKTTSIAPHGQLTVRVSLQTNVTSARCIVTPLYP